MASLYGYCPWVIPYFASIHLTRPTERDSRTCCVRAIIEKCAKSKDESVA